MSLSVEVPAEKPEETTPPVDKFEGKSREEILDAYHELEKKFGARGEPTEGDAGDEAGSAGDENKDDENKSEGEESSVTYGDAVDTVLLNAGLTPDGVNTEWQEKGELSEETYKALTDAGYPKEMVDHYIAGLQAANADAADLSDRQTAEVMQVAGGAKAYEDLTAWATENLPVEDLEAFNAAVDTGDVGTIKQAVRGIKARYDEAVGLDPSITLGGNQRGADEGGFKSRAELVAAMKDPRYKTDPAYRNALYAKMEKGRVFRHPPTH